MVRKSVQSARSNIFKIGASGAAPNLASAAATAALDFEKRARIAAVSPADRPLDARRARDRRGRKSAVDRNF
jgi:hypothetical protein